MCACWQRIGMATHLSTLFFRLDAPPKQFSSALAVSRSDLVGARNMATSAERREHVVFLSPAEESVEGFHDRHEEHRRQRIALSHSATMPKSLSRDPIKQDPGGGAAQY